MEASLRFVLRKDLANKKGEQPIVLMVSMGGQKRKISTGIALLPELWSEERKEIAVLTSKKLAQLEMKFGDLVPPKGILMKYQAELNELKFEIQRIEEGLRFSGTPYNPNEIVSIYKESKIPQKKEVEPENLVYDFIDQYIKENELSRVKGSMVVYKSLKKHLKNFQDKKRRRVRFENMDYSFMQDFQNFLIEWKEVNPALQGRVAIPLMLFLKLKGLGCATGISFVDSTPLRCCHDRRIHQHKTFKGIAERGQCSLGWFFRFKSHLIINYKEEVLAFTSPRGTWMTGT